MTPAEAAAAAIIHDTYKMLVSYTGAGGNIPELSAVKSTMEAEEYAGSGKTKRRVNFEVQQSDIGTPSADDRIVELPSGPTWRVNQKTRLDAVGAWLLDVEVA
jgi:hypothetical protein